LPRLCTTDIPKFRASQSLGRRPPETPPFRQQPVAPQAAVSERGAVIVGEGLPNNGREQEAAQTPGWRARLGSISVDWWATAVAGVIVALAVANVLPKVPW
jgi:hypothetical protein